MGFSFLSAGLNYFIYPILKNILSPADFGDFAILISFSAQLLSVFYALNIFSLYLIKNSKSTNIDRLIVEAVLLFFKYFVIAAFFLMLCAPLLMSLLNINNALIIPAVIIIGISAIPLTFFTGKLQAEKKTAHIGLISFFSSLLKFVSVLCFSIFFHLNGAVAGITLSSALTAIFFWIIFTRSKSKARLKISNETKTLISNNKFALLCTIVTVVALGIMQNMDIVFTKALFDSVQAGQYAGIGLFSNAMYFVGFFLTVILLSELDKKDIVHTMNTLKRGTLLLSAIVVLVFITNLFIGQKMLLVLFDRPTAELCMALSYAVVYQGCLSLLTLYSYSLLVLGRFKVATALGVSFLITTTALNLVFTPGTIPDLLLQFMILALLFVIVGGIITMNGNKKRTDKSDNTYTQRRS